jgi:Pyridoxamine 5'-phosphate oxidase
MAETQTRSVEQALAEILTRQKTLKLATAGGPVSPWITGTYFISEGLFTLFLTLEKAGKGMANVHANPKVALTIDDNNPFLLFLQAEARASIVDPAIAAPLYAGLRKKIPEIEPLLAGDLHMMRIDVTTWRATSFPDGWFPARVLKP